MVGVYFSNGETFLHHNESFLSNDEHVFGPFSLILTTTNLKKYISKCPKMSFIIICRKNHIVPKKKMQICENQRKSTITSNKSC